MIKTALQFQAEASQRQKSIGKFAAKEKKKEDTMGGSLNYCALDITEHS